ncbi:MAG: GAF domain-containing sensor histidine kinase [Bryobacteraceae bacterium]|jgi:signal transduction histidine kinase
MFREPLAGQLALFARLIEPYLPRLNAALRRYLKAAWPCSSMDARQLKALLQITSGAAARVASAGRLAADFYEQVAYNSRRLAKLNVSPMQVLEALRRYDREIDDLLALCFPRQQASLVPVRQQLHFRTLLAVNNAYYQVREAETQAFYGLLRAEMEATGLDDLLQRFILILTRTFRAQTGRMVPFGDRPPMASTLLKRLARPCYIAAGSRNEELILDRAMRGAFQSYWSVPFFSDGRLAGLVQFGFGTPYRWLPRELDLLDAFAERCLRGAERARMIQDLAAREEQVRSLAAHLLHAEEEERRRISRELHDEAGQSMLFLRLHLEMLEKSAPADLRPKLAEARGVTERIVAEVRRIIAALHPSAVEELGLPAAIRHLSARFRKLYPIRLRLRLIGYGGGLPHQTETAIYRVVQECYQNIGKHSRASRVNLLLRSTDILLEMKIDDDGVGFDVERAVAQPKSFGLKGMRERVALLGGCLEIRSSPGHGATISMRLPISR